MPDDALNAIALETTLDSVVQCTGPSVATGVGEDLAMVAHENETEACCRRALIQQILCQP